MNAPRLNIRDKQTSGGAVRLASFAKRAAMLAACSVIAGLVSAAPQPVFAQSWWPFGGSDDKKPPVPREPVYRQPPAVPAPIPPQQPAPGGAPPPAVQPSGVPQQGAANWNAAKNPICLQLEQRLVQEGQKGNQSRDQLARVEQEQRQVDQAYNAGSAQLERNCYEVFLFTKSFRNTPQCKDLARQVEVSKRRLSELEAQRQELSSGRNYQDDIVRELARNNCGANYVDQARRGAGGDSGMWTEEGEISGGGWTPHGGTAGETFKTVCVRLCDGYYFPISFSTLRSHFAQDAEACSSKCSAPAELYFHPNPGGTMEQAVALQSSEPYTKLKTAFRYRKEYVQGCSCKESEYVPPSTADQKADAAGPRAAGVTGRAAGAAPKVTTGSTSGAAPANDGWETQAQPE